MGAKTASHPDRDRNVVIIVFTNRHHEIHHCKDEKEGTAIALICIDSSEIQRQITLAMPTTEHRRV
jgi:hypothetical protein